MRRSREKRTLLGNLVTLSRLIPRLDKDAAFILAERKYDKRGARITINPHLSCDHSPNGKIRRAYVNLSPVRINGVINTFVIVPGMIM